MQYLKACIYVELHEILASVSTKCARYSMINGMITKRQ
jgi:hypothetical protein